MQMQYADGKVRLSPREAQVVHLVCAGHTNRQIAAACAISEHTVGQYLTQVSTGLRLSSRSEIVLWGLQHPGAVFDREWVAPAMHLPDCSCHAPYCVTMRGQGLTVS